MSNPVTLTPLSEIAQNAPSLKSRHNLYEIDQERKTAFCTVCGYTEIHIRKCRAGNKMKIYCLNRFREITQENTKKQREKRHSKPSYKPRHSLSEIDPEKRSAICSACGPTGIWKDVRGESLRYICAKKAREYGRNHRSSRYSSRVSNPLRHVLSEINEESKTAVCSRCGPVDIYIWQGEKNISRRCANASIKRVPGAQKIRREMNINMINRYKVEHGCKRCGYNKNLRMLYLYGGHSEKKELKIEKLLKLTSKELTQTLEDCEVFCVNCRSFVNYALVLENLKYIDY